MNTGFNLKLLPCQELSIVINHGEPREILKRNINIPGAIPPTQQEQKPLRPALLNMKAKNTPFLSLCQTITQLRSKTGCPWDKKQTILTLRKYVKEECDELLEAMENNDPSHLCEEIGDVLFLLLLVSEISSESDHFSIEDVITGANNKMIRRHPHVFAGLHVQTDGELKKLWEKIKFLEKEKKTN